MLMTATALVFAGCQSNEIEDTQGDNLETKPYESITLNAETEQAIIKSGNDFAFRLFNEISKQEKKENVFVSPLSLSAVLSMTSNGANGATSEEMLQAMSFAGYTQDEVNTFYKKLSASLLSADSQVKLTLANSIWTCEGFPVLPDFLDINKACYNAEIRTLPFDDNALNAINQWSADKTNNCIPKILDKLDGDARMFLLNSIYFKGAWTMRFDKAKTKEAMFRKEDGTYVNVNLMKGRVEANNIQDDDKFTIMELPYGNKAFSMMIFIPKKGVTMAQATTALTSDNMVKWEKAFKKDTIAVGLPRFKQESDLDLIPTMEALGMNLAFNGSADFSKLTSQDVLIALLKQKSYIEVNEEGSEAGATTAGGINGTSPQNPFEIDCPFIFMIRENSTKAILFMGKIGDPKE